MIRIGYSETAKEHEIAQYLSAHTDITKIYVVYFKAFPLKVDFSRPVKYIEWEESIMYRTFYPALEDIDENTLIIVNECMRTQTRQDLHYNCIHHYLNQCGHRIIFEYFPFIEGEDDFMILMDFEDKGRYTRKPFESAFLKERDILIAPRVINMNCTIVQTSAEQKAAYEFKKNSLFDNLGSKSPDTIPRTLQLMTGDMKAPYISADKQYVARNKRFKRNNVITYKEVSEQNYCVLDFHYRRLNFNDYLQQTGATEFEYISTDLSIDTVLTTEFRDWKTRLEELYAKASLC